MEIVMRDKRIIQLSNELDQTSQNLNKMKVDLLAFEKQCSNYAKSLATSDRALRNQDQDKNRLARDLGAARDAAHSLDRNKDTLQEDIRGLKMQNSSMSHQLESLQQKLEDAHNINQAQVI
jgi:chromosome segregation ATPase